MSYATSDKRIEALKSERRQLISAKQALERRIDELCAENERLRAAQAHWELGNCPNCPNVVSLQEALEQNAKLREHIADLWEFGFSKNAGANSVKEWYRRRDELEQRTYELLGVTV